MAKKTFLLEGYFPIYHKTTNKNGDLVGFYSSDNKWKYKISDQKKEKLKEVLLDLFGFLENELKESKLSISSVEIDDDTRDDIFNSIRSIIKIIYEKRIVSYSEIPGYQISNAELAKKILTSSGRQEFVYLLDEFALAYVNNDTKSSSNAISAVLVNPYKLHANFKFDSKMQDKLVAFSDECKSFLEFNTSDYNNLYLFFSGNNMFKNLKFNISMVCIKRFFELIHSHIDLNKAFIIRPLDSRLPSNFLCQSCEMLVIKKTITDYFLIKHSTFKTATSRKCSIPTVRINIDKAVNVLL